MEDEEVLQALANLQLPHMPPKLSLDKDGGGKDSSSSFHLPSIRILVVADVDLSSTAALAEYFLQQQQQGNDAARGSLDSSRIDLCIACGPFGRDQDARTYVTGRHMQRRLQLNQQHQQQQYSNEKANQAAGNTGRVTKGTGAHSHSSSSVPGRPSRQLETSFSRTKEETAGLEGLMTAALSQLESIVCRVVYCPGFSDPITSMVAAPHHHHNSLTNHQRLTPNSRNIHKQWLPLAPALGCAGLVYLDSTHVVVGNKAHRKSRRRKFSDSSDDDGARWTEDEVELLTEQLIDSQHSLKGYFPTLLRLLKLAPAPNNPLPFARSLSQSILVTHYVDFQDIVDENNDHCHMENGYSVHLSEDEPLNGSPSWAIERHSPWPSPSDDRDDFVKSKVVQQLLCLEIASGSAAHHLPHLQKRGNVNVLFPGSLRTRGNFAIVDLSVSSIPNPTSKADEKSLEEEKNTRKSNSNVGQHPGGIKFHWKVTNVDFHDMF